MNTNDKRPVLSVDTDKENKPNDITTEELAIMDATEENTAVNDDIRLIQSQLDTTDEEGEPLNEKSSADDQSGKDLDVPGAEDDDDNEDIGEEDEENNEFSLRDQDDNQD